MNYRIKYLFAFAAVLVCFSACDDHELPSNPVRTMPVKALVMEVNGEEYTAVPSLLDDGTFSDVLTLAVKIPSQNARVVSLSLSDGCTTDFAEGEEVTFDDYRLPMTVMSGNKELGKYWVEMVFNPPPFYYFIKSSDKDAEGARYYLDLDAPVKIASGSYDNYFEGEVDLTATNWDNVGLISSDLSTIYNLAAGPWPAVSYYEWTAETKQSKGDGYYPSDGPWNDWLTTNGNTDIVSPGVWRVNFDSSTSRVCMTMTQWAVFGSAVDKVIPMLYDSESKSWSLTCQLSSGTLHFETIPVTFGDPRFTLAPKKGILGDLASDGEDIVIESAGPYTIKLTLSDAPYYTYSISR